MAVTTPQQLRQQLVDLEQESRLAGERFLAAHGEDVELYRREISRAIVDASDRLRDDVAEITAGNPFCAAITAQLCDYVEWLQWSLWDLPYFAATLAVDPETFRERVAGCGYVYLAGRVIDDALDRHFSYKARRSTLVSVAIEQTPTAQDADRVAFLGGLLLCAEGLYRLAESGSDDMLLVLRKVLHSFRRAVIGALMEHTPSEQWTRDFYERLVILKNVDFWRCLYSAVDPERRSPLYPFLERYYAVAQKLNDVVDFPEDAKRGQPNLLSLYLRSEGEGPRPAMTAGPAPFVPEAVERDLAFALVDLGVRTDAMPELEREAARLKLAECLRGALQIGLFAEPSVAEAEPVAPIEPPPLTWFSTFEEVVAHWGAGALEDPGCGVCGSRERLRMMEFRGFSYHTCASCSHVYVAPRVRGELLLDMASRLEHEDDDNEFLDIQKIFAEPICHLIRLRAPGSRLLDLGFGRGHILRLARAYGFEVYGMDTSSRLVQQLSPEFGNRLAHGTLGIDAIPWDYFDVVVMSHVIEHLSDPGGVLRDVLAKLSPGGVLYAAVPDIGSLQFRVFGKYWDAINPMVHMQYFNEASLSRLLRESGFVKLERIKFPPLPRSMKPKWMQLFRDRRTAAGTGRRRRARPGGIGRNHGAAHRPARHLHDGQPWSGGRRVLSRAAPVARAVAARVDVRGVQPRADPFRSEGGRGQGRDRDRSLRRVGPCRRLSPRAGAVSRHRAGRRSVRGISDLVHGAAVLRQPRPGRPAAGDARAVLQPGVRRSAARRRRNDHVRRPFDVAARAAAPPRVCGRAAFHRACRGARRAAGSVRVARQAPGRRHGLRRRRPAHRH
jgi:SAM-dependent methyltransferase